MDIKLAISNNEYEKKAAELIVVNQELAFQNQEKEKRATELILANEELAFQNQEKEKRAAELILANRELAFQNQEKEKRATELIIANRELAFQNQEKEKRATELIIANRELAFQNQEKEKRAAELVIANKELAFQNQEKERRAAELVIANKELAFQNQEKERRAAELILANEELAFQNQEKEKRAAELVIANNELAFQNEEKEKRAVELRLALKELLAFTYISSHDLQEPLRKIQTFAGHILNTEHQNLSANGKDYFKRIRSSANRMQQLIIDLLVYSRINNLDREFEKVDLSVLTEEVLVKLSAEIAEKQASIDIAPSSAIYVMPFQFKQLLHHLIDNSLKFSNPGIAPRIVLKNEIIDGVRHQDFLSDKKHFHISVEDNGIGFEHEFSERIFDIFQRLHQSGKFSGTGIGLAIVRKIVENHSGVIIATGELNKGAKFDIYIPVN